MRTNTFLQKENTTKRKTTFFIFAGDGGSFKGASVIFLESFFFATWQRKRDPRKRATPLQKKSRQISNAMLRGRRKALLALRQQFSSCSATTTTTTKKATTKAKSKNSKEQPCSALAIIADAGHGLGDFQFGRFFPKRM